METSLLNRLQATLLAIATAALVLLAVLNFRQETQFQQPDDGVWWREVQGGLEAVKVLPNSPGQRAGIQEKDLLTAAEVLPDTSAKSSSLQTQDLLTGDKPLAANPTLRAEMPAKERLPKSSVVHLADLEHVLYRSRNLRKGQLRHHPRRHPAGYTGGGHSRAAGPQPGSGAARHRAGLPGHRHLCPLPPLDSAARHPLLPLLPGFVRPLRAEIHRRARQPGLDRLLAECPG